MAFQEMGDLYGAAREFAENKGYGPLAVDSNGWPFLHHAAAQSQRHQLVGDVQDA